MNVRSASLQWRRLRESAGDGSDHAIASTEMAISGPEGPLRLAVGQDGGALLLIPVGDGTTIQPTPAGRGLEMREVLFRLRGATARFLELGCRERRLEPVFEDLVEVILQRVADGDPPVRAAMTAIGEFRDLLAGAGGATPGIERIIGLLAELRRLNALLEASPVAWAVWTGPLGGRHDFRAGALAVECKATLRSGGSRITISSIDQLSPPTGGDLFLDLQVFERDAGGAWSVSSEAGRALSLASDRTEVVRRLQAVGCDPDAPEWDVRFSLLDEAMHAVAGDFPRLVADDLVGRRLPPGVVSLTYQIDPGTASSALLDAPETRHLMERLANAA